MQALYGTDITVDELKEEVELEREALIEEFVEDALVLDPCTGETPFVLRADELIEYRKFDAEAMFADA